MQNICAVVAVGVGWKRLFFFFFKALFLFAQKQIWESFFAEESTIQTYYD
jgi:hypothetical protein